MQKFRRNSRDNHAYAPLRQNISDDDDDDEDKILFDQNPTISSTSRNGSKRFGKDVIELENLQGSRIRLRGHHRQSQAAVCHRGCPTRKQWCILIAITLIIIFATAGYMFMPSHSHHTTSSDWSHSFGNYISDSCIRLVDVDKDGQLDILVSLTTPDYENGNTTNLKESCNAKGLPYPCAGQLLAIRGRDGQQLWELPTKSSILSIHCNELDADHDGLHDCLISGYHATLQAINPRSGVVIWSADSKYLIDHWHIYQVLVVPDVNQDNIDDVLILHSHYCWDDDFSSSEDAGRFLLFSGATGQSLGTFVNATSKNQCIDKNLVLYKSSDNNLNILFSGGQQPLPGALHHIHWDVLRKQILDPKVEQITDIKTIYENLTKGFGAPPVIADVHNDGVMDILVNAFDGNLILYDSRTFKVKWKINFDGYESFSIPAPGYFNNDAYLDFMLHLNYGTYPAYTHSMVVVVSGKDGAVLWKIASSFPSFNSDLTLQMVEHQRDMFVFKVFDREGPVYVDSNEVLNGVDGRKYLFNNSEIPSASKTDFHISYSNRYFRVCSVDNLSSLTEEVFLMDRSNMDRPYLLADNKHYPFPNSTSGQRLCIVVKRFGRGTGAIGDVDGDDQPDYISLNNLATVMYTSIATEILQNVTLHKRALSSAVNIHAQVPLKVFSSLPNNNNGKESEQQAEKGLKFEPQQEQVWTEYLGSKQTGVYRRQHLSDGGNTMSRRSRILYYLVVFFTMLVVLL